MKTPEEIYKECLAEIAKIEYGVSDPGNLWDDQRSAMGFKVSELYHKTMLSQSIPSEEEIQDQAIMLHNGDFIENLEDFHRGAKWIIELLTKGDK